MIIWFRIKSMEPLDRVTLRCVSHNLSFGQSTAATFVQIQMTSLVIYAGDIFGRPCTEEHYGMALERFNDESSRMFMKPS